MKTILPFYTSFIFLFCWIGSHPTCFSQIVINEVCSKNTNVIEDEFGDTPDWIEIYNNSSTNINLEGFHISDEENNLQKWQFPNKTIAANSHLIIFASSKNVNDIYCHTNFKLSNSGETIILSDNNGNELDRVESLIISENHSFGRIQDGAEEWVFFDSPTPEFSNNESSNYQFAGRPTFENQQYFYENNAVIKLTCSEPNCSIRFTRDGSLPDENSELFDTSILLDTTTCIRAATFVDGLINSPPATHTFFINANHTLPVLAMTSEPRYFWDWETGIFVMGPNGDPEFPHWGANFWQDVEVPLHVEFFKSENLEAEFEVGTKIHGGKAARSKPMKALRFLTDGDHVSSGMNYPFFENKNIENYRRIVVRNASGDYNYTHFRDAYLHRYFLNEGLDLDVLAFQPVAAYVNGIYWGVMNLREKIDRFYLEANYGMHRDSIDLLEEDLLILEGSADEYYANYDYIINNDLSIEANFAEAAKLYDISNIADYLICQTYVNNTDFPNNNIKFWQPKRAGGKWRFLLFDMDVAMGRFGWTKAEYNNFQARMDNEDDNRTIKIVLTLLENENYRHYFINRYADLMNTIFSKENLKEETQRTVAEIDEEMKRHFVKWTWPGYETWSGKRLDGLFAFIEERPEYQRDFVRQYFQLENSVELQINTFPEGAGTVKINTITPESLPWKGHYYNGVPVTLTIIPNNGFTFQKWESIHTILERNSSTTINYNFEKDDEITAFFETNYKGLNLLASPNPFEDQIQITFTLDQIATVNFQLFDALGRLIQTFPTVKKNGGTHSISLNIKDLNRGIYFIQVATENHTEVIKVIN